jgi:hypothetical protein
MCEPNLSPNDSVIISPTDLSSEELEISTEQEPIHFETRFQGIMEMYSHIDTVTEYLDHHEGWFVRCASPMRAEPFGENGYTLIVGHYGAFGYEVEPQMSVILDPPQNGYYLMYSVPNPNFNPPGYEVSYQSTMNLEEIAPHQTCSKIEKFYQKLGFSPLPSTVTRINWSLQLVVKVRFPRFIYKLPMSMIQKTGDRVLAGIVSQISPRLSYKVQKDFHSRLNLPIPPQSSRTCVRTIQT